MRKKEHTCSVVDFWSLPDRLGPGFGCRSSVAGSRNVSSPLGRGQADRQAESRSSDVSILARWAVVDRYRSPRRGSRIKLVSDGPARCKDYRRTVDYPRRFFPRITAWCGIGGSSTPCRPYTAGRHLLRFNAVDYLANVWLNGAASAATRAEKLPLCSTLQMQFVPAKATVSRCVFLILPKSLSIESSSQRRLIATNSSNVRMALFPTTAASSNQWRCFCGRGSDY